MVYSFIWKGTDCRAMGIRLQNMPEIVKPEERVSHIVIPGRSGELTQTEGDNIYNSYIQTVPFIVDSESNVRAVEKWLQGDGYVTFSGQSDLKQKARVINAVTLRKHSRNSAYWEGEVQFYCDPLKEKVSTEANIEVTQTNTTVVNPGDVASRPKIVITGAGSTTVRINSKSITVTGAENGWAIDSDTQWVTANGTPQMGVYSGVFPTLEPGNNTVFFSGSATKLTITPRWRYL